ncbi:MAG: CoA-binding protein [Clostridia bacterium]|nr:MAG: CoA-binding protein [Clostridia bacterium]
MPIDKVKMQKLINPRALAVVGASDDPGRMGGFLLTGLLKHRYSGKVFPVNPRFEAMEGLRCYSKVSDIPEPVDCMLLTIPASQVLSVLEDGVKAGVPTATIFSSGFGESDAEGKLRQQKLAEFIDSSGMLICGPNCYGVLNLADNVPASCNRILEMDYLPPGPVALVSQSGAMSGAIANRALDRGVKFSFVISTGNECGLEVCDFINFLLDDRRTRVVAVFLEGLRYPEKFLVVARKALDAGKPLVVLKVGRSEIAARTASAHTGALVGSDLAYEAVFRKYGVIRANSVDEMVGLMGLLSQGRHLGGTGVGTVCLSGGAASIVGDACEGKKVQMTRLAPDTITKLKNMLVVMTDADNPVDVSGEFPGHPEAAGKAVQILAEDAAVDSIGVVITTPTGAMGEKAIAEVIEVGKAVPKPLATIWLSGSLVSHHMEMVRREGIPLFTEVGVYVSCLEKYSWYLGKKQSYSNYTSEAPNIVDKSSVWLGTRKFPSTYEGEDILAAYGIRFPEGVVARTPEEAVKAGRRLGYPVVLKVQSPDILHKTEVGGVKVGIWSDQELLEAYQEISRSIRLRAGSVAIEGILVQKMIRGGIELILGISRDSQFGHILVLGLGGIYTEILKEVVARPLPVSRADVNEMIEEMRGGAMLKGARGQFMDLDAVIDAVVSVSRFGEDMGPRLKELDINPLLVLEKGKGVYALDSLLVFD